MLINKEQIIASLSQEDGFTREHAECGTAKERADIRFEWLEGYASMPHGDKVLKRALQRKFKVSKATAAADWRRFVTALMNYNPNSLVIKARLALELEEEQSRAYFDFRTKKSDDERDYRFDQRQRLRDEVRRHHRTDDVEPAHKQSHASLLDADRGPTELDAIRKELLSRRTLTRSRKEALLNQYAQALLEEAARED